MPSSPLPPHDRSKKRAKVAAQVNAAPGRATTRLKDHAIAAIREKLGEQSNPEPLVDSLLKSLSTDTTEPQIVKVNILVLSVLYALRRCTSPSGPPVVDPCVSDAMADSVNDTLLLAVFIILLFSSPTGYATRIEPVLDTTAIRVRVFAPCPECFLEFLLQLQDAKITVESAQASSETVIGIPLS